MKKFLFFASIAAIALLSCTDSKPNIVKEIKVNIQANLPAGETAPDKYAVQFINYNDNYLVETTAGPDGKVSAALIPGIYTISVKGEVPAASLIYNGSLVNITILNDASYTIEMRIAGAGALVFKELYYCGSRTPANTTYFRDQFYEIYNNSEAEIYVDGLCIAILYTNLASANLPTWDIANQDDYVFLYQAWLLPGDGTEYPLQPGESIIVCQWATDHTVSTLNPNSLDLSSCEYEAIIPGVTNAIMTDGPPINMELVFNSQANMLQWLTTVNGAAFAIFFPDGKVDFVNHITQVGLTARGIPVPLSMIIDAVELVTNAASVQLKRIPTVLDAGAIFVSGQYVQESVSRKIRGTSADGRLIYQDTNNSTDDFEVQTTPMIRRNGAMKPAWNIWGN